MQLNRLGRYFLVCFWLTFSAHGMTCGEAILSARLAVESLLRTAPPSDSTVDRAKRLASRMIVEISDRLPADAAEMPTAPVKDFAVTTLDSDSPDALAAKRALLLELNRVVIGEIRPEVTDVSAVIESPDAQLPVVSEGFGRFLSSWGATLKTFALSAVGCHNHPECSLQLPVDQAAAVRDVLHNLNIQRELAGENVWKRRLTAAGLAVFTAPVAITALAVTEGKRLYDVHVDLADWTHRTGQLLENPDSDETSVLMLRQGTATVFIVVRHVSEEVVELADASGSTAPRFLRLGSARPTFKSHVERHPVMLIMYRG